MKRDLTLYLPVQVLGIPGTLDHHERRASQLLRAWNREVKFGEFSSVQFSCSDMSDSLRLHGLQHARLPCPLPTPGVYSNSCPLSRWCHPTISSSVVPFFSCLQSFPASGSFPMRQFFASGGQSIGVSPSASVLPMNIQDWFPLGWAGWISLQSKGLSRVFSNTTVQKYQFFHVKISLWSNSHIHIWLLEKPSVQFSSVWTLSPVQLFATLWTVAHQASLFITNSWSLPKFMSIESVMPPSNFILHHPLLLLPPFPPSIRVFSNDTTLHEVAKVLEFQL